MTTTRRTHLVVITTVVLVSTYTLAMSLNDVSGDTVSEAIRAWSSRWWVVPAAAGALAGHWWGPPVPPWWPRREAGGALAALGLIALGCGVARWGEVSAWWQWWGVMGLGALLGAALWPMETMRGGDDE